MKKVLLIIATVMLGLGLLSVTAAGITSNQAGVNLPAEAVGAFTLVFDKTPQSYDDTPTRTLTYDTAGVTHITGRLPGASILIRSADVEQITLNFFESVDNQYEAVLQDGLLSLTPHPTRSLVILDVDFGDVLRFFGLGVGSPGIVEILLPESLPPRATHWAGDDTFELIVSGDYEFV